MKIISLLILSFLTGSCKKAEQTPAITGQWEWYKTTGGFGGIEQTPQNSGFSWQLTLRADRSAMQTGDLVAAGNGTYTLTEDMQDGQARKLINITINAVTTAYVYSFISKDRLRLDQDIQADGFSYFLVRE